MYHNLTTSDLDFLRKNCKDLLNNPIVNFFKSYVKDKEYLKNVLINAKNDLPVIKNNVDKTIIKRRRQEIKYLKYLIKQ